MMVDEQQWTAEEERAFWEDVPAFPEAIYRLMEDRGIESVEELHKRVVESGLGGIDRYDRNTSLWRFTMHVEGETRGLSQRFVWALEEVLQLTREEKYELIKAYFKATLAPGSEQGADHVQGEG